MTTFNYISLGEYILGDRRGYEMGRIKWPIRVFSNFFIYTLSTLRANCFHILYSYVKNNKDTNVAVGDLIRKYVNSGKLLISNCTYPQLIYHENELHWSVYILAAILKFLLNQNYN